MAGTSRDVTWAIEVMPPMITAPTRNASTRPKMSADPDEPRKPSSPPVTSWACAKVWLAWNMLPPTAPKRKSATAKMIVSVREAPLPKRSKATGR
jgi:hypothetical protein